MPNGFAIADITAALAARDFPTMVVWNRLEGRPRTHDFERALGAEVRDALWMLTRQWQVGEFRGDDAGSPVTVQLQVDRQPFVRLKRGDRPPEPINPSIPMEAAVERRPLPMTQDDAVHSLDLRLLLGRRWLRMTSDVGPYDAEFIAAYSIDLPDSSSAGDASIVAHLEVWQTFAAVAGRRMDGWKLYEHLRSPAAHAYDGVFGIATTDHLALDERATAFREWVRTLIHVPSDVWDDAWVPDRLEYRVECSAGSIAGEQIFTADEYRGGSLDWYALDSDPARSSLSGAPDPAPMSPTVIRQATVPVQVTFQGMPSTRWWELEDGRTNFGKVRADTTDLAKLLLIEFGLVYGNDWFVIPCTLPTGSVAAVRGLVVTNVFGERIRVESANRAAGQAWSRFTIFAVTSRDSAADALESPLLLLPAARAIQEGVALEDVLLVRDEIANMVWGIERSISLRTGAPAPGFVAGRELATWHQRALDERLTLNPGERRFVSPRAPVRYRVATSVPEEWIPFIPVHVPGDTRQIQLQRGAMPRILDGDPDRPAKVRPQTTLLRAGLDVTPKQPYFLHEEEVPRAGVRVTQRFRRARWHAGKVVVWLAAQKLIGRGGASSGLAFDVLADQPGSND